MIAHDLRTIEAALQKATEAKLKAYDVEVYSNTNKEKISQTEDALCEVDNNVTTMLAEIQDALCELDERLSGEE